MNVLICGLTLFFLSLLVQLVIWKVRVPARQTMSLLYIFFGIMVLGVAYLCVSTRLGLPFSGFAPSGTAQYLQLLLFLVAVALGYTIAYSGIEADSPSLVMVLEVADAGPGGLSEEVFYERLDDEVLVAPRVRDLFRDRHVYKDGEVIRLTGKGRRFIGIFIMFRKILGAPLRGG